MSNDGYIKLHRVLQDAKLWQQPPDVLRLAIYLMIRARHSDVPAVCGRVTVRRGELVTSLGQIADDATWWENQAVRRWNRQRVQRMLAALVSIEFIEILSDTFGTHVRLCNYERYQGATGELADTFGHFRTLSGTNNKEKNGKNEKKTKTENTSCPELPLTLAAPDSREPEFCRIPLIHRDGEHAVTIADVAAYRETYPAVDVEQAIRECRQWNIDNPTRRKTRAGIRKHLNGWLSKEQDRGKGGGNRQPAKPGRYRAITDWDVPE